MEDICRKCGKMLILPDERLNGYSCPTCPHCGEFFFDERSFLPLFGQEVIWSNYLDMYVPYLMDMQEEIDSIYKDIEEEFEYEWRSMGDTLEESTYRAILSAITIYAESYVDLLNKQAQRYGASQRYEKNYFNQQVLVKQELENILKLTSEKRKEIELYFEQEKKRRLMYAENQAKEMINGLSFNVYSNDIFAHLLYAFQEKREMKKQAKKAEAWLFSEQNKIESEIEDEKLHAIVDFNITEYGPLIKLHLHEIYKKILQKVTDALSSWGYEAFNYIAIKEHSRKKALQILTELNYLDDDKRKKQIIVQAVQACPYCRIIADKAKEHGLYNDELNEIFHWWGDIENNSDICFID